MNCRTAFICVILAAGAVGWALRSQLSQSPTLAAHQQMETEAFDSALEAYRLVPMRPLSAIADETALAALLREVTPENETGGTHSPADVESVSAAVAGLFHARHFQSSVEEYLRWRSNAGYVFVNREQLLVRSGMAASYAATFGRPPADDQPLESVFADVWGAGEQARTPVNTPRAFAADPAGRALIFGNRSTIAGSPRNRRPTPAGRLGAEAWSVRPGAFVRWFVPAHEAALRNRESPSATYALLVEYGDGSRRPLVFHLSKDPAGSRWLVEWITVRAHHPGVAELY
ncbi:MAG: hypothetical protein ACT4PL_14290 [Phycisphaerales bacterium]